MCDGIMRVPSSPGSYGLGNNPLNSDFMKFKRHLKYKTRYVKATDATITDYLSDPPRPPPPPPPKKERQRDACTNRATKMESERHIYQRDRHKNNT